MKKKYIDYTEMPTRAITHIYSLPVYFMLPPSIHFEISIPQDAYNFETLGAPLTPWGVAQVWFFFVDYRYTYLDIVVNNISIKKMCLSAIPP